MSEKDSKIILTHRTPGNLHALIRAFFSAWFMVSANECLVVRFEIRPIDFNGNIPKRSVVGYYEDNNE